MTRTFGEVIDEKVAQIIEMVGWVRKPDHPFYDKTDAEVADLLLMDEWNQIFIAEEVTKKVKEYYNKEEK